MKRPKPLDYQSFRKKINLSHFNFNNTAELSTLTEFLGQARALDALTFGIGIQSQGFNLYAMGPSGIGKRSLLSVVLSQKAAKRATPTDWCYIHNFENPENPIAFPLKAGMGVLLAQDMKWLINEVSTNILSVLESDEYRYSLKKISDYFDGKRKRISKKDNRSKLDKSPFLYKEQHQREKELQFVSVTKVVKPIINKLRKKYFGFIAITSYLTAVEKDITEHASDFIKQDEKTNLFTFSIENPMLTKYKINLLVDNSKLKGAPIVFEDAPTYSTLICRIEHTLYLGSSETNFTLIKPGALHRANGGYLIIEARKLKKNREAWEALKSALYARKIRIKSMEHEPDTIKPISLEPMPIPLDVKVILVGSRNIYYSLCQHDPDFIELFKVAVDFDDQIERNKTNIQLYARLIGTIAQHEKLRPFHVSAVAELIDHSSRLTEDIDKLSIYIRDIQDLILESDYWAGLTQKKLVERVDVKRAIKAQIYRMDRAKEIYHEEIQRDFININTEGKKIGQVNCLSVRKVGNFSYGHPTRVTARVRLGKGQLMDIQREIKMAGPMHSKAGLIIINFLASHFTYDKSFSLYASLSFEQIYCWTDGDSASVGELCALLSALADVPLYQSLAITGSVDQYGKVQTVGGINEKVEGFFDVCKKRRLNGQQGVIIPMVNVKNLMLREDIQDAAKAKQFFIYPIQTVEEAIELLTGFSHKKIYHKIETRLKKLSKNLKGKKDKS